MPDADQRRNPEVRQLEAALGALEIDAEDKANLSRRYLEYVDWIEAAAARSRRGYYALRVTALIAAAIVPALVAADARPATRITAAALGVLVAAATATETFLRLGERWRHYRTIAELLKSEGWLFAQRAGPYKDATAREAVRPFTERIEALIRDEVRQYVTTVVTDRTARPPETHDTT
jgi:hypothetical protein